TLTYGELDRRADAVAAELAARGAGPGRLVGVFIDKGWEQVVAVLGVLKSGAAYVPLDTEAPPARIRMILEQAGIQWVLNRSGTTPDPAWAAGTDCLRVGGDVKPAGSARPPVDRPSSDDLAYVIFTSGSTGAPKGVMVEHGAAANTVHDINQRFDVSAGDRALALSALHFDLSVFDVFGILGAGGAVVMPEPGARREPGRWLELAEEHRVTVWNSVPALMDLFAEYLLSEGRVLPAVRLVMLSGDWIPLTLPDRLRAALPDAELWSLGGATEAAIWSILYRVDEVDPRWVSVPYGRPLRNQRFHVLDSALRPRPVWVPGALHIAGRGLARGYLGDDERTRAAFLHHPVTGERLYRTGDVGRYRPDGTIELLGREDQQVKIGGHRVELGEVEAALERLPGVSRAVAAVTAGPGEARRLAACAVFDGTSGVRPDPSVLIRHLREVLPAYMVPRSLTFIDRVPLTANGKVDRAALPVADGEGARSRPAAARNETERELVAIWSSLFAPQPVGVSTDFFELGGDSLLAVRLMARIRARFGVSLPVSLLFDTPTVAGLAEALATAGAGEVRQALVPVRTTGSRAPLFFVHPVGGDVVCYSKLVEALGSDQPVYALQTPAEDVPGGSVEELAEHYAGAVRQVVGEGPYRLGGWSMGGVVALEMARLLTQHGSRVDVVVLIDPPAPGAVAEPDDAALLAWLARDLAGIAGRDRDAGGEEFRATDGTASTEVFRERAVRAGILPEDVDAVGTDQIVRRFSRNARALAAFEPAPADVPVRLFRACDGEPSPHAVDRWRGLLRDCRVLDVPGDHYTVMREPAVRRLAEQLRDVLEQL
ncbi:amino acid adenylation domain-containing protein, partial [Streptomyces zhihengii]|uniref:amino acid adenylation domain-containing protein n=1 Tax=Streptomyces zhihengii TaxID=1818004 RepID=UPI0033AC4D85